MKLIENTRSTLEKFTTTSYILHTNNFTKLCRQLPDADRNIFPVDISDTTFEEHEAAVAHGWKCLKKYKLKEDPDQVDEARARIKWLKLRELVLYALMYFIALAVVYACHKVFVLAYSFVEAGEH